MNAVSSFNRFLLGGLFGLPVLISLLALNRKLKAAENLAKFGLAAHQAVSPQSSKTVLHLGLLAEVLRGQSRFAEAEGTVREAIDLLQPTASGEEAIQAGQIYELYGSILRDQTRYSEALKAGKKGCEMLEELKGMPGKETVVAEALSNSYYELSRTLNFTGQPEDAITLLHLALDLRGESVDRHKASILAELSRSYLMSGEFKEAECAVDQAMLNLSGTEQPEEQLARARVILAMADVLRQSPEKSAEERSQIQTLRAEALAIRKKWLASKDPELLDIGGG
jgi:tetratricopeptide (TPR) repeat protein